jgi:hypothetical protein
VTNSDQFVSQEQLETVTVDNSRAMIDESEELAFVRDVLSNYDPDYVLETVTTAEGLALYLAGRGSKRALLVRTDSPDELEAMLQDQFPDRVFDIIANPEEVAFLLDNTTYEDYVLLIPANLWVMAEPLDKFSPDYILVSSVDLGTLRSATPVRDFAPTLDEMKAHYRQFEDIQPVPAPSAIDATSNLQAYLVRHKTWPDAFSSALVTISWRDRTVVGR